MAGALFEALLSTDNNVRQQAEVSLNIRYLASLKIKVNIFSNCENKGRFSIMGCVSRCKEGNFMPFKLFSPLKLSLVNWRRWKKTGWKVLGYLGYNTRYLDFFLVKTAFELVSARHSFRYFYSLSSGHETVHTSDTWSRQACHARCYYMQCSLRHVITQNPVSLTFSLHTFENTWERRL